MTTEIQTTTDMPGVQSEDDFEMLMNELDDPSNGWSDALPVQEDPPTHVVDTIIATKPETDMPPTEDQKLAKQRFDTFTSDAVQEVNTTFQRMCVSGEGNLINAGAAEIAGLKFLAGNKDELLVFMAAYDMRKYIFTKKDDQITERLAADIDEENNTIALGRKLYIGLQALKSIAKYHEYSEENINWMRNEIGHLQSVIEKAQAKLDDENTPLPLYEPERVRIRMSVRKIQTFEKLLNDDPDLDEKDQPSSKAEKYNKAITYVATNFPDCGTYNKTWADVRKRLIGKINPANEPYEVRKARYDKFNKLAKDARVDAAKAEDDANALLPQTHNFRQLVSDCNALKQKGEVHNLVRAAELEHEMRAYWSDKYMLARHSVQVCNQRANEYMELAHALIPPGPERKEAQKTKFTDNEGREWHLKCLAEASNAVDFVGDVFWKLVIKRPRSEDQEPSKPKKPKTNRQLSDEAWDELLQKDLRPGVKRMLERKRELQRRDNERISQQASLHKTNLKAKADAVAAEAAEEERYQILKAEEDAKKALVAAEQGLIATFRQQMNEDASGMDERKAELRDAARRVKRVRNTMTREIHAITNRPNSLARILDDNPIATDVDSELAAIAVFESEDSQSSFTPVKNAVCGKAK